MPASATPKVLIDRGMVVAAPTQIRSPSRSEQLFNWFYDAAGRPFRRPGSVFYARLGEGPILGMAEHAFHTRRERPKLVAAVANRYERVTTHADNSFQNGGSDGTARGDVGLAVDAETHGRPIFGLPARPTDRFTFASLFDVLYIAGSTTDYTVRSYDYARNALRPVEGIRARGVVEYRNRLYAWGDPADPAILFPSEFADPETFRPELGIRIGDDGAPIVSVVKAGGLLVIGTESGTHYYLGFAPELGDLETDDADELHGVVGPLAAALAEDGFVYWLSHKDGPCRWRRGMEAADTTFAAAMHPIFRSIPKRHASAVVVRYDELFHAVHFFIPTGTSTTPNYLVSYWPSIAEGGAWTHGASTEDLSAIETSLGISLGPSVGAGDPLYTTLLSRQHPVSAETIILAGDEAGFLWKWRRRLRDKCRTDTDGQRFTALWRSGAFDFAPVGRQALIHQTGLDLEGPTDFEFRVRSEADFSGVFDGEQQVVQDFSDPLDPLAADAFQLQDALGDGSVLAGAEPRPDTRRIWLWRLANVLRLELETSDDLTILGVDSEASSSAR